MACSSTAAAAAKRTQQGLQQQTGGRGVLVGAGCCYGSVSVFERRCPFASICCLSAQTVWQSHANICICTSRVGDLMGDIMHMLATAGLSNSSAGQSPHLSTLIRTWCSSAAVGEAARHAFKHMDSQSWGPHQHSMCLYPFQAMLATTAPGLHRTGTVCGSTVSS